MGGTPTRITFSGQNIPVRDVVAAIRQALGPRPNAAPPRLYGPVFDKVVTINWQEMPFWQAAAQLEELTGRRWVNDRSGGIELQEPGSLTTGLNLNATVVARTPYFLVEGTSLYRSTSLEAPLSDAEAPRTSSYTFLHFAVYADPKIKGDQLAGAKGTIRDAQMQLEPGGAWTPLRGREMTILYQGPISGYTLSLPESVKPGTTISRITGTYHLEVSRENQTWSVPDILGTPTASETIAGSKITYQNARLEGEGLKVSVSLALPATAEGFGEIHNRARAIKLTDSAGNTLKEPERSIHFGEIDRTAMNVSLDLTYTATENGKPIAKGPVSLAWTLPKSSRSFPVPFELKDIKVP